jgi:hypothetical protein
MLDDPTQTKARMWREKARNFQSRGYVVTSEMAKKNGTTCDKGMFYFYIYQVRQFAGKKKKNIKKQRTC